MTAADDAFVPTEENTNLKKRAYWLSILLIPLLFLYLIRTYSLQVVQGNDFKELSDKNRMRAVAVPPPRGLIYDRHGNLLVANQPEFNLYAVYGNMPDHPRVLSRLTQLVRLDLPFSGEPEGIRPQNSFSPVKVKGGLSLSEVARIEGSLWDLPGLEIVPQLKRHATAGPLAAHILGYIGEISKAQLEAGRYPGVRRGSRVGQFGVEQQYEAMLRGTPGEKWIEVDAHGRERRLLKIKKPRRGNDLFLTIDWPLQQIAEETLGEETGSIVAMDPNTGEILALVSHPSFDPNLFSEAADPEPFQTLLADSGRRLFNRAIQGQYPPGSTFKIVVGAAALETKMADPVECTGSLEFGNRIFRDWKKGGHGRVDIHRAIVESCDVYFYRIGHRLGIDTIAQFAQQFGLGRPTGVTLPFERSGLVPSTEWKRRVRREPWHPGETLSVAIGQGYVSVTPMQMAVLISAVANNGILHKPTLFYKSRDAETGAYRRAPLEKGTILPLSKETLEILRKALADAVAAPAGTAAASRSSRVPFAGKTGTAQVIGQKDPEKALPKQLEDHAWFVSYAPLVDPKIAVVVLVEHGGHGASAAAPRAKKVLEGYLARTTAL